MIRIDGKQRAHKCAARVDEMTIWIFSRSRHNIDVRECFSVMIV